MGVPLNHPFEIGIFHYEPEILRGTHMTMETSNYV